MSNSSAPPLEAPNVSYLWAQCLVEELVRNGVQTFFVAPGSRSTPLTVAAARHPDTRVVLHVDERGTAFAALGFGRATNRPAAWITTSGTAVANGQPAVVEASVDGVPMILLTADRPPELRDTGANQTIDQVKIFGDYVRWHVDVPVPTDDVDPAYVLTTVDQAVLRSGRAPAGPVHLNCAFRKPLEPIERPSFSAVSSPVRDWASGDAPYTNAPPATLEPSPRAVDSLFRAVRDKTRGLLVAGRLDGPAAVDAIQELAGQLEWPLVPDLTSHLRLGKDGSGERIAYGDLILTSEAFREAHLPDAVLQVGGRFSSKRLRHFLRDARPRPWAVVRPDPGRIDPDHRTTHHLESHIVSFVEALCSRLDDASGFESDEDWRKAWRTADERAEEIVRTHADEVPMTEPGIASIVSRHVPPDHALVAASSMPVRDLNRHASTTGPRVWTYANRGASGIDGTVATAAGVVRGHDGPVTLLIGDLALWHDLNSLALLHEQPAVVVVINNDGGGIFHFLPIREHEEVFDPYFTTPQGRTFASVADTFDLAYRRPDTLDAFRTAYRQACDTAGPVLIEVQTDRSENRRVHEALEREVAAAVER